jgi:hypothetical protein
LKTLAVQWSFGDVSAVPLALQLLPVQPLHVTHVPLAHWLLLVHQQAVPAGLTAPVAHSSGLVEHVFTHPSVPPVLAAPVQVPDVQPLCPLLAQTPLLHWLLLLQMQAVSLEFGVPVEHVKGPLTFAHDHP